MAQLTALVALCGFVVGGCGSQPAPEQRTLPRAQQPPSPTAMKQASPTPPSETREAARRRARQDQANRNVTRPAGDATSAGGDASAAIFDAADEADFAELQSRLGGQIGLAASPIGIGQQVQTLGPLQTAIAWSTSKVPIAMAIYDAGLADSQQSNLTAAITASDNTAADRLWEALGGGEHAAQAADAELRNAGDARTSIQASTLRDGFTPFGQTVWPLADQARFTAGMTCLASGGHVLGLMGQVVAGQRWGLGAAGVPAQFKGGWGPGSSPGDGGGYLDRQAGILTISGVPIAFAVASLPADGDHQTGTNALTRVAQWAVDHARVGGLPRRPQCP